MFLLVGRVETAKIGMFGDLEVTLSDRDAARPSGGHPQYNCRVIGGSWPGLEELRLFKRDKPSVERVQEFALQSIPLPKEDEVLQFKVVDITGSKGYKTLLCELVAA